MEAKSKLDDAWYTCDISLANSKVKVTFVEFTGDEELISTSEEAKLRLRFPAHPLEDKSCRDIQAGDLICGYHCGTKEAKYFDAKVIQVHCSSYGGAILYYIVTIVLWAVFPQINRAEHENVGTSDEICNCTFKVIWQEGKFKGKVGVLDCGGICLISQEDVLEHPLIKEFLSLSSNGEEQNGNKEIIDKPKRRSKKSSQINSKLEKSDPVE